MTAMMVVAAVATTILNAWLHHNRRGDHLRGMMVAVMPVPAAAATAGVRWDVNYAGAISRLAVVITA